MITAALDSLSARERNFLAFVRNELAPSEARWRGTLRLSLACVIMVAVIMTLHIPQGEFILVTLFVVSQSDAWASVSKAMLRVAGTLVGGALGILSIICFGDKPFLLYPMQALVVGVGLFFNRTTTAPYAFLIGAFTYVLIAPDFITTPAAGLETGLWRLLLVGIGAVVGTGLQLFLWPAHPEVLLLADLAARLEKVETILDRFLTSSGDNRARSGITDPVAATHMAGQLDLLSGAEQLSRWLRQRHTEQVKMIVDIQRLVTAALRLERSGVGSDRLSPPMRSRVGEIRAECARLRRAIGERHAPAAGVTLPQWRGDIDASAVVISVGAALTEMEDALARLPRAMAFLGTPAPERGGYSPVREPVAELGVFTPACSPKNYEAIRFALKGALGVSICGLFYPIFNQPEVSTCIISCIVVAQATVGASRRKGVLRAAGAAVGGFLALGAIAVVIPNASSLAPLLIVTAVLFGMAAWVVSGSGQTSYVGMQMAIALSLVLINGMSPAIDLAPAGDRMLGVFLGVAVMWAIDVSVWPVFARTSIRRKLAEALAQMAKLQRDAWVVADPTKAQHGHAVATYRILTEGVALQGDLQLEADWRDDSAAIREAVLRLTSTVQGIFLHVLAVRRHPRTSGPAPLGSAEIERLEHLDRAVANRLDVLADILKEGTGAPESAPVSSRSLDGLPATHAAVVVYHDLIDALDRLETSVTQSLPHMRD